MLGLARAHRSAGHHFAAIPLLERAVSSACARFGDDHLETLGTKVYLAATYIAADRRDSAIALLEQTVGRIRQKVGAAHPATLDSSNYLADAYLATDRLKSALPLFELLLSEFKPKLGPDHPRVLRLSACLAFCLLDVGRFADAELMLRESLAQRVRLQPDNWFRFNIESQLGGALLGQKKYSEAEILLVTGYEGMKSREEQIPAAQWPKRLPEALDRLIKLYEETNRPDEAAKYKTERDKLLESAKASDANKK
jgi:tetratricopeptide (TPR) repeat protein